MSGLPTYQIFGIHLASGFAFASSLRQVRGTEPDVVFSVRSAAGRPKGALPPPVYVSPLTTEAGEPVSCYFRLGDHDVWRFPGLGDFHLYAERIDCYMERWGKADDLRLVELRLLGPVLAVWLELRGLPVLHASAVEIKGRAAVFLSTSGAGKSSLAASLLRLGSRLLTDDLLCVEPRDGRFLGQPAYPQMRLWPDQAAFFLDTWESLETIHPDYSKRRVPLLQTGLGEFCGRARPIGCIYLPERSADTVRCRIFEMPRRDTIPRLVGCSFSPLVVEALGLSGQRLGAFVRLVRQIPVCRLSYPHGFDELPAVAAAIREDFLRRAARR